MAFNRNNYLDGFFLNLNKIKFDSNELRNYIIPLKFEGRPDLISYELYGDVSYQAFLSYINRIYDTPEGYYTGRKIKYVDIGSLE